MTQEEMERRCEGAAADFGNETLSAVVGIPAGLEYSIYEWIHHGRNKLDELALSIGNCCAGLKLLEKDVHANPADIRKGLEDALRRNYKHMKRTFLLAICLLTLSLFCGCSPKEQNNMEISGNKTILLVNDVRDADIWILPETEANLKTTVWGAATAAKVKAGERRTAPLCEPGADGLYIFRMIDADGFFYSSNGVVLKAGWTLRIKGDDFRSASLEVLDENGGLQAACEVFAARL